MLFNKILLILKNLQLFNIFQKDHNFCNTFNWYQFKNY